MHLRVSPLLYVFLLLHSTAFSSAEDNGSASASVSELASVSTVASVASAASVASVESPVVDAVAQTNVNGDPAATTSLSLSSSASTPAHSHNASRTTHATSHAVSTNSVSRVVVPGLGPSVLSEILPHRTSTAGGGHGSGAPSHPHQPPPPATTTAHSGSGPNVPAIVFGVLGALAGLLICGCLARFAYNYRRTPRADGVRAAIERHALDRELREMEEAAALAASLPLPSTGAVVVPPPPYQRAPEYDDVVREEGCPCPETLSAETPAATPPPAPAPTPATPPEPH